MIRAWTASANSGLGIYRINQRGNSDMDYTRDEMTVAARERAAYEPETADRTPRGLGGAHLGKAVESRNYDMAATTACESPGPERFTLQNIEDAMNYQPWTRDQQEAGAVVREALTAAAKAILRSVPDGAFRSVALRNIIDARMNSNAAISFRGRF